MKITKLECTSCGHPLEFKPGDEMVTCRFCGSVYSVEYDTAGYPRGDHTSCGLNRCDTPVALKLLHTDRPGGRKNMHNSFMQSYGRVLIPAILVIAAVLILSALAGNRRQQTVQENNTEPAALPASTPLPTEASPSPSPEPVPVSSPAEENADPEVSDCTPLLNLTSIEEAPWRTDRLTDNYGNRYTDAVINNHGYNGSAGPIIYEYLVNKKYQLFRGTLYIPEGERDDGTTTFVIRGDGHTLYTSPSLDKTSQPVSFEADISGFNDIQIEWSNNSGYRNISGLNCCLAEACFVCDDSSQNSDAVISHETLPYSILDLESIYSSVSQSRRLTDNQGNRYSNAIYNRVDNHHGNHEPVYEYTLNRKFSRMTGVLYVPEGLSFNNTVQMYIYADDVPIYTSPSFAYNSEPVTIDIDITGCDDLKITFSDSSWYDSSSDQTLCLAEAFLIP